MLQKLINSIENARSQFESNMVMNWLSSGKNRDDWKAFFQMLKSIPQSKGNWSDRESQDQFKDLVKKLMEDFKETLKPEVCDQVMVSITELNKENY
jgi:predicted sugar kinase